MPSASNTEPDLLTASLASIGVLVDHTVIVAETCSYKPASAHWRWFQTATGARPGCCVQVATSLFHDIAPCGDEAASCVDQSQRRDQRPARAADLPDCTDLPTTLARLLPA